MSGLGGIGGYIKSTPAHFRVCEVADERDDYVAACNAMDLKSAGHAYVTLTRTGQTTRDVVNVLARAFAVQPDQIGTAGLKDRHAICTQTFSLPRDALPSQLRAGDALGAIGARCSAAGFVLECEPRWHRAKLRTGQLRGNRFEIVVTATDLLPPEAEAHAHRIADVLRGTGWANFYGPQRFGKNGPDATLARSRELLTARVGGGRAGRRRHAQWLDALMLNGLQSALFNECVSARIRAGKFGSLWAGDLVCPPHSAARPRTVRPGEEGAAAGDGPAERVFDPTVRVPDSDAAAFSAGEISFTGPLFGAGMAQARGAAGALEAAVWREYMPEVSLSALKPSVLSGGRRVARLALPSDFCILPHPEAAGVLFRFTLPRGAFATSLLREFVGRECDSPEDAEAREALQAGEDGAGDPAAEAEPAGRAPWMVDGVVGLRLSCESVLHEKKATAQCLKMLAGFASFVGQGSKSAFGLVADGREQETTGCRSGFSLARTGIAGMLFLRCAAAPAEEPIRLAVRALEEALQTGVSPAPLVVRLLPCQAACSAETQDIVAALEPLLRPLVEAGVAERSYCVEVKQRGATRVDRQELITHVGRLVKRLCPDARVDLERAHFALTVDVFDGTACLALLPHWHRLHGYNLRAAAAAGGGDAC